MRKLMTLPERPTAVFINNNLLTVGALLALKELGLHCPEDVGLVGFDDHPWAAVSDPPLTVVRQPAEKLGRVAAQMLLELIHGQEVSTPRVIMECDLIVRESS